VERRRRLHVIQGDDASTTPRPWWAWVGLAVVAIVGSWIPLTALALATGRWASDKLGIGASFGLTVLVMAAASAGAIALGAAAGGYILGRWGPRRPVALGVLAGVLAGGLAGVLSAVLMGRAWLAVESALPTVLLAASGGAIGAWSGARGRSAGLGAPENVPDG